MLKKIFIFCIFLFTLSLFIAGGFLTYGYFYITRDLPKLNQIEDYKPDAVSQILTADNEVLAEFFDEKGRRYPIKISQVPVMVRNAFLAAEDASFYKHPGINPLSIIRAFVTNLVKGGKQGGSTITQQVVKNLLLTKEKSFERKIKEAILSYRLEDVFSKDEILEMYLNEIFFGNRAYGIQAASQAYFRKDVSDLTIAEAAMLAGLPKAPSASSPISHFNKAQGRQFYVLDQMRKEGFITQEEYINAKNEKLKIYKSDLNKVSYAPFYVTEVRRIFQEKFPNYNIDLDGLKIYTPLNIKANQMAERALVKGLKEIDKRRGWRGKKDSIESVNKEEYFEKYKDILTKEVLPGDILPAMILSVDKTKNNINFIVGKQELTINGKDFLWATKETMPDGSLKSVSPIRDLVKGDIIEISFVKEEKGFKPILDQTPDIEGALVLINPRTGEVVSLIGGANYQTTQFNRVTQAKRQPGSVFKPIVYLTAIDAYDYTAASIVYDSPRTFRVNDSYWVPNNFDGKFLGPITLREALQKSRNLVSVDIISNIGVESVIRYARKLGIESDLGKNLSLSLGSGEVSLLELTRAYGVFPAGGILADTVFITKVEDRNGNVIYDYQKELANSTRQVIGEDVAFIMSYLMKGVVDSGTGYRVKALGRPAAGKTGTSNDFMDTWFVGFTPKWAAGVWAGFDTKKLIGKKETGGTSAAPIWLYFMKDFLEYEENIEYQKEIEESKEASKAQGVEFKIPAKKKAPNFMPPPDVVPYWINKKTGVKVEKNTPGAFLEYFKKGTAPNEPMGDEESETINYLEQIDL